ncbi:MAG: MaoC family dehydratase [Acidimicrobiales bacterium]|nr:MaoC family dehydratase [Acidimicrobiales bacterium]
MHEIPFDDIDAINAVGGEDAWSDWGPELEVTQEMINGFADLTGDHQWIHVDVERATAGPFGAPIAHGFLTLSLMPSLNKTGTVRLTGHQNVVNYGADGLRFLAPVPVGSKLHARNRIKEARQHKKGTLLATQVAIHGVGSEVPALLYEALVLYQG